MHREPYFYIGSQCRYALGATEITSSSSTIKICEFVEIVFNNQQNYQNDVPIDIESNASILVKL